MKKLYSFLTAMTVGLSAVAGIGKPVSPSLDAMAKTPFSHLKVSAPAPLKVAPLSKNLPTGVWTDWESCGTGTFTMDETFVDFTGLDEWQGDFPGINVDVRKDTGDSNIQQYRLSPIFCDATIIVDYNAETGKTRVARQETNIDMDGFLLQVLDFATAYEVFWGDNPAYDPDEVAEIVELYDSYNYFIEPIGRIYLFLGFTFEGYDDLIAMSDVTFQIDGYPTGLPEIIAPRYFAPGEEAKCKIELEEGITSAKVGIFNGIVNQKMLDAVMSGAEGVFDVEAGGEFELSHENVNELMSIVAISYANGIALDYSKKYFTCIDDEEGQWTSLGEGEIVTDLMEGVFEFEPNITKVEVQQNITNSGVYRVLNSYDGRFPYNEPGEYDTEYNHYLVFDATDPECVLLGVSELGIDWNGAAFVGGSLAIYEGLTVEEAKDGGYGGTLIDGVITFPKNSLFIYSDQWTKFGGSEGMLYYANTSGMMSLKIPSNETTGIEEIISENDNDAVYYNLQGVRVDNPVKGSVVIRANNGKAQKIVVK